MIAFFCHQLEHMKRKNRRMSSSDSDHEHVLLLSQIKGAFECVICLDVPSHVPIPQCENGHILCRACRDKVLDCPVCKVKLGKSRCLAAEKVLELCPRPCEFEASGCKIRLIPSKLVDHIKICKFAPIQCVYMAPQWEGSVKGTLIIQGNISGPINTLLMPAFHFQMTMIIL